MTRLTNSIREALLKQLTTRAFNKKVQDHIARCADFADRVYKDALKKDLAQIEALPDGWLSTDTDIKVQFGSDVVQLYFSGNFGGYSMPVMFFNAGGELTSQDRRFPQKYYNRLVKVYTATEKLSEEYTTLTHERKDLCAEIDKAYKTAAAALDSVSTVKKLIEVWPEVEEFARPYLEEGERRAILPAIPRAALNAALDLPPSK